jgi:Rho-binding antiterminator
MISCQQYDYVEIACMYHYPIKLLLKSGCELTGIAQDTQRNACRDECLKLETDKGEQLVVLDTIAKMQALVENPHFKIVNFNCG